MFQIRLDPSCGHHHKRVIGLIYASRKEIFTRRLQLQIESKSEENDDRHSAKKRFLCNASVLILTYMLILIHR